MGKFKRIKDIFHKVQKIIKDVGDKVIKPVIRKVIKHAPGLMKVLVKVIKVADKVGARRVILNLIPEAGPYVNQAVDYLIKAQKKGVIDDACGLLQKVIDGRINMKVFIEEIKKLIGDLAEIEVEGMPNPAKILNQVIQGNGPLPKLNTYQGIRPDDKLEKAKEIVQEQDEDMKLMRGDRETLMKEALAREGEEYYDDKSRADDIFGPAVNK